MGIKKLVVAADGELVIDVDILGFDPLLYVSVVKVNSQEFLIKHKEDESLDKLVTCDVDEDDEIVDWDGLAGIATKKLAQYDFSL